MGRTFKIERDWNDMGCKIFRKGTIELQPGVTVLVGCNGIGKSTLIKQLEYQFKQDGTRFISFNNLRDGGSHARSRASFYGDFAFLANSMCASEGENINMNLVRFTQQLRYFVSQYRTAPELWMLLDAVDSGLSVDNILDLKDMFKAFIEDNPTSDVYIVISANEYELARGEQCFDVLRGNYKTFRTYEAYRKFIIKTREEKDKRVYKET